jgi:hypothetical protein
LLYIKKSKKKQMDRIEILIVKIAKYKKFITSNLITA